MSGWSSLVPLSLVFVASCADGTLPSSKGPDDPTNPRAAEAAYVPAGAFERRPATPSVDDAGAMQHDHGAHGHGAHAGHANPTATPSSTSSASPAGSPSGTPSSIHQGHKP